MKKFGVIDWVAVILVAVGAINWGLYGLWSMDLVKMAFGDMTTLAKAAYVVIGLAGVYTIVGALRCCGHCNSD